MTRDDFNLNQGPVDEGMRPPWYDRIEFRVAGGLVPIGAVWVHLKDRPRGRTSEFVFTVPLIEACSVFAAKRDRSEDQAWADFIRAQVEQMTQIGLGNEMLLDWLRRARHVERQASAGFLWVVSSVVEVFENDSAITIRGVAEEFVPQLY